MSYFQRRAHIFDLYHHLAEHHTANSADDWHRRETLLNHEKQINILGYPFRVRTNSADVVTLAELSERHFSRCAPVPDASETTIDLFAIGAAPGTATTRPLLPADVQYVARGSKGIIHLSRWGSIFADWHQSSAFGFLSTEVLQHAEIASRHALDPFILMALLRRPVGVLHASGLVQNRDVVLLIGPRDSGRATVVSHFMRAGYRLISNTMVFICPPSADVPVQLAGYLVDETTLSSETESHSTASDDEQRSQPIRSSPAQMESMAVIPQAIALYLTQRSADEHTHLAPLDEDIMLYQIIRESGHLDQPEVMAQNFAVVHQLIMRARNFIFELGGYPEEIVDNINFIALAGSG